MAHVALEMQSLQTKFTQKVADVFKARKSFLQPSLKVSYRIMIL